MADTPLTDDARTLLAALAERPVWEIADLRKRLGWPTARIVKVRDELGWLNAQRWTHATYTDTATRSGPAGRPNRALVCAQASPPWSARWTPSATAPGSSSIRR